MIVGNDIPIESQGKGIVVLNCLLSDNEICRLELQNVSFLVWDIV